MATNQEKTQQLVNDQLEQRDPFAQARKKSTEPKLVQTADSFDPFTDPLKPDEVRPVPLAESDAPAKKQGNGLQVTLEQMLKPNPAQVTGLTDSTFAETLRGQGRDTLLDGLSFSQLGRFQLISRLRQTFGEDFDQNPEAENLLLLFNQGLKEFESKEKKQIDREAKEITAQGKRTLDALIRGV